MTTRLSRTPAMAALLLAVGATVLTGCNGNDDRSARDQSATSASPTTPSATESTASTESPSSTDQSSPTGKPGGLEDWVIRPGSVGEVRVGMTRAQWTPTGLFAEGPALCGELIHWKQDPKAMKLFVLTDEDATITQLNVSTPGPHTERGNIEVGSTYGELKAAWGDDLTAPESDGWDSTSVQGIDEDDATSITFLLRDLPDQLTDDTLVQTISVSGASKSYLQYDC